MAIETLNAMLAEIDPMLNAREGDVEGYKFTYKIWADDIDCFAYIYDDGRRYTVEACVPGSRYTEYLGECYMLKKAAQIAAEHTLKEVADARAWFEQEEESNK